MRPLTPRQERFCHEFVHWAQGAVAAREAGYSAASSRKQGYRLLRTARVRARIQEIQAEMARDGGGADVLIGKLEVVYRRAIEDHHFAAAARAVELQARLGLPSCLRRSGAPAPRRQAAWLPPSPKRSSGFAQAGREADGKTAALHPGAGHETVTEIEQ